MQHLDISTESHRPVILHNRISLALYEELVRYATEYIDRYIIFFSYRINSAPCYLGTNCSAL